MVVVVVIATGATIALKAYNSLKNSNEPMLEKALFTIQQQAGVMAALCGTVFAVITALRTAKISMPSGLTPPTPTFGTRTAGATAASPAT
jgi:hypothetical protein